MDASILMLYIPRNRKLDIAPRLSRAHQTRTGRNIHKKNKDASCPLFLVARCFLLRSAHGRAERPGGSVGSWTVQLLLNSRLLLHSQVHLDYTPLEKKSQEAMGTRRQGDGVNIARALRSRSPRTFSTLPLRDRAPAKT